MSVAAVFGNNVCVNLRTEGGGENCNILNISVARWNFIVRFGVFLEPSKLNEVTLSICKSSNDVTGREGGWMISW